MAEKKSKERATGEFRWSGKEFRDGPGIPIAGAPGNVRFVRLQQQFVVWDPMDDDPPPMEECIEWRDVPVVEE
jgi:hypothetical protein